jgi:hypothetical protein
VKFGRVLTVFRVSAQVGLEKLESKDAAAELDCVHEWTIFEKSEANVGFKCLLSIGTIPRFVGRGLFERVLTEFAQSV